MRRLMFGLLIILLTLSICVGVALADTTHSPGHLETVTPIPIPTETPIASYDFTLTSGRHLSVVYEISLGDVILIIIGLCLFAAFCVRFIYDLVYQWVN